MEGGLGDYHHRRRRLCHYCHRLHHHVYPPQYDWKDGHKMVIMLIIICFARGLSLSLSLMMVDKIESKKLTLSPKVDQSNSIMLFFNCRELHWRQIHCWTKIGGLGCGVQPFLETPGFRAWASHPCLIWVKLLEGGRERWNRGTWDSCSHNFQDFYGPDSGIIFPRLILFCKCSRWWIWWWHIWSNSGHGPNNENREGGSFWLNTEHFISQFSRFALCHGSLIFCFTFTFLLPLHHHNRKSKSLDISGAKPSTWASTFDNLEQK